jgi:NAD+ diphosphatase
VTPLALSRAVADRAAFRRTDEAWLARAWENPGSRVLLVDDGRALVGPGPQLALVSPEVAGEGERLFLGVEGETAYFSVAREVPSPPEGTELLGIREVGTVLDDRDAGLLVHSIGLHNWHARNRFCPNCGAPTEPFAGGHVRRCTAEGIEHYPRTDPAVIMLVHDGNGRCLLGRSARWAGSGSRRFSTLAGFVEPGESLEQAVAREVAEEVGVAVRDVRYEGSQPWPFPASLMVGFTALAEPDEPCIDGDEIVEACWFERDELREACETGDVVLSPRISIARALIENWYGGKLPN